MRFSTVAILSFAAVVAAQDETVYTTVTVNSCAPAPSSVMTTATTVVPIPSESVSSIYSSLSSAIANVTTTASSVVTTVPTVPTSTPTNTPPPAGSAGNMAAPVFGLVFAGLVGAVIAIIA